MRRRRSNAGLFQRLLEGGSRTTYHGKIRDRKGKRTAQVRQGKQSVYKGVRIIPVGNGEFETSLDSSRFESKRDARRFVDSWKERGNPTKRRLLPGSQERFLKRAIAAVDKKQDKQDYGSPEWRRLNEKLLDLFERLDDVQGNPRGSRGDFSRCVKAVSQRKGVKDPEAICAGQERKRGLLNPYLGTGSPTGFSKEAGYWYVPSMGRYDSKTEAVKAAKQLANERGQDWQVMGAGRYRSKPGVTIHPSGKRNPPDAAMAVSEEFHGRKVKAMVPVSQKRHYHKYLAELGELRKLEVLARDGKHRVTLSKFDGAMLCTNEDKNQLFLVGGDQGVDLRDFGIKDAHETETLGEVTKIEYFTDKEHLGSEGGEAVYVHKFRTTNGRGGHQTVRMARNPDLIYYLRDEHLEFSGGSYFIRAEGIDL